MSIIIPYIEEKLGVGKKWESIDIGVIIK